MPELTPSVQCHPCPLQGGTDGRKWCGGGGGGQGREDDEDRAIGRANRFIYSDRRLAARFMSNRELNVSGYDSPKRSLL